RRQTIAHGGVARPDRAGEIRANRRLPGERAVGRGPWHGDCFVSRQQPTAGATMSKSIALSLAAFGMLAGCAHTTTPPPAVANAEYRIGKEDVVSVEVWKDPALSAKVPVRPDGKITLPMVGDV